MEGIRQYLLSVTAAAILCGILTSFLGKKGSLAVLVRLMAGLFLTAVVIRPLIQLQLSDLSEYTAGLSEKASAVATEGASAAYSALSGSIKARTEAYILDKAENWGAELVVEVSLSDSDPPVPESVSLTGQISPYGKARLSQMIAEELGIGKEKQIWTGGS